MRSLFCQWFLFCSVLVGCVSTVEPTYQSAEVLSPGETSLVLGTSDTTRDFMGAIGIDAALRVALSNRVEVNGYFRLPGWASLGAKYLVLEQDHWKASVQHLGSFMRFEEGIGDEGETLKRHVGDIKTIGVVAPSMLFGFLTPYALGGFRVSGSYASSKLTPDASVVYGLGCEIMPKNGFGVEWGAEVPLSHKPELVYLGVVGRMVW